MRRFVRRTLAALALTTLAACGTARPYAGAAQEAIPPIAPASASGTPAGPKSAAQLPQGGTTIFPAYRVVAFYGTAGTAALGVLGEGSPDVVLPRLRKAARGFAGGRKIQVAYELIASIAQGGPGPDGDYSHMIDMAQIQRYVDQARRNKVLVILDLQPGRGTFLPQAKRLEKFLLQPHVGLALDPEWRLPPGKIPGKTIGQVGPSEVNAVSAYVSGLVTEHGLPQKLFVLHQFRSSMLPGIEKIQKRPGLAMVQHVDGFGTRSQKDATWNRIKRPRQFHMGYKLFYDEDVHRYGPVDVLRFTPVPELVSYQ